MHSSHHTVVQRALNTQQLDVLEWLFRFRFSTSRQLAIHLNRVHHKSIQRKLQQLEARELIGKHYDGSYKLAGRPAEYFLTPRGARQLELQRPKKTNEKAINTLYKNKTVSRNFLTHCIHVTDAALNLQRLYGSSLDIVTKSQLVTFDYMPYWLPDLYLVLRTNRTEYGRQDYFLDVWDETKPFFISIRRARAYVNYKESGEWPDDTLPLPNLLSYCLDDAFQNKMNRPLQRSLLVAWDNSLIFATITKQQVEQATSSDEPVWRRIDPDYDPESSSLEDLYWHPEDVD